MEAINKSSGFGKKLQNLIEEKQRAETTHQKKKTVKEIATDLKISYQSLLNYQEGKIPSFEVLERMANYFGVNYVDLISDNEKRNNAPLENISDLPFSNKAINNLNVYSNSKKKSDIDRISTLNKLLENAEILDSIATLINNRK